MEKWQASLRIEPARVRLLVTGEETGDLLKAVLPMGPQHPRAMLTLLEGVALYRGERLDVAVIAEDDCPPWLGSELFGDALWPAESQLVRYRAVVRGNRQRVSGLGDFSSLRIRQRGGF